ncbi:MAG: WD40 repeat domain-containing protein [Cyanobacteria bacterium P01_A01_bin.105]
MPKQIATQLSTHTVHLGDGEDQFEVTVNNLTDHFATFALDLSASGVDRQASDWYRLTPDLSAKIPAGDQANFVVNILEVPPVPGGFTGKMNLSVNVTCLELGEEDRQPLNLVVAGSGALPPTLHLPENEFRTAPGDLEEIPLQVHNPNRNTANVRVVVRGLPNDWLTDGHERRVQIAAQSYANILFICQPPISSEAVSGVYPFEVEVSYAKTLLIREAGSLEVLPTGHINFICQTHEDWAREASSREPSPREDKTNDSEEKPCAQNVQRYILGLENQSNVDQTVALTLNRTDIPWHERVRSLLTRRPPKPAPSTRHCLQLTPAAADLTAGDTAEMTLTVTPRAPWLGWPRQQQFQLRPKEQQTGVQPADHTVTIQIRPQLPFWAQCVGAAGVLMGAALVNYWQAGHRAPVNSVQFDGQANTVVSASDDQTLHRWQVRRGLRDVATLKDNNEDNNKAVRVVRYRPRHNNLLAAGLENGEIQLWDFLARTPPLTFGAAKDDRVFDLAFTPDSQSLFSAHGSGDVLRWPMNTGQTPIQPQQQRAFNFAIQSMALVGPAADTLALAGRFNRLVLWNFEQDQQIRVDYPAGDGNQYIFAVEVAAERSTRLATADNQGRIMLWDLSNCLDGSVTCRPSDQWAEGHGGAAVNTVALTKDACYLVSGGSDGRIKLWHLSPAGQVMGERPIDNFRQPINSVDVLQQGNTLLIVSGGNNHHVRLHRARANNPACP